MIINDLEHLETTAKTTEFDPSAQIRGGVSIEAFAASFAQGRDVAVAVTLTRTVAIKFPIGSVFQ